MINFFQPIFSIMKIGIYLFIYLVIPIALLLFTINIFDRYDIPDKICTVIFLILFFIPIIVYIVIRNIFLLIRSKYNFNIFAKIRNKSIEEEEDTSYIINSIDCNRNSFFYTNYIVDINLILDENNFHINRIVMFSNGVSTCFKISFDNFNYFFKFSSRVKINYVYKKLLTCSSIEDLKAIN